MALIKAFRTHGHLAAQLDPLGTPPIGDPALDPGPLGLTPEVMAAIPSKVLRIAVPGRTLAESLPISRPPTAARSPTRSSTSRPTRSGSGSGRRSSRARTASRSPPTSSARCSAASPRWRRSRSSSTRPTSVRSASRSRASTCWCRCSISRSSAAAESGARDVVIGMAHRGRLNVLAHTIGRPYETIFAEFEGGRHVEGGQLTPEGGTGDVKYHHGAEGAYVTAKRHGDHGLALAQPEPPGVRLARSWTAGRAPSRPSGGAATRTTTPARRSRSRFTATRRSPARASWPRRSTSARSRGTAPAARCTSSPTTRSASPPTWRTRAPPATPATSPRDSTSRSSTSTRTTPRPAWRAVRLAMAYRDRFHQDVLIDLSGYRRHGHNEGDEPAYTQPVMYERISALRRCASSYAGSWSRPASSPRRRATRNRSGRTSGWWTSSRRSRRASGSAPSPRSAEARLSGAGQDVETARRARVHHVAQRAAPHLARGLHRPSEAREAARAAPRRAGPTAASIGPTPRRSRSPRC